MIYQCNWSKVHLCYRAPPLNASVQANEQHVMTYIRSRIKKVLRTAFRMRKQEIAELMHDPVNLDQANPATRRSMGRCYRLLGVKQN